MKLPNFITTMFKEEPGWVGMFTRNQAEGAWENGTRVIKQNSESDDGHPNGSMGTILGSIGIKNSYLGYLYFVEWDQRPRVAVGVMEAKLRKEAHTMSG